jgi:hypothetical protein
VDGGVADCPADTTTESIAAIASRVIMRATATLYRDSGEGA